MKFLGVSFPDSRLKWFRWVFFRILNPVGWFAMMTFDIRPRFQDPQTEFWIGTAILLAYAVMVGWPGKKRPAAAPDAEPPKP